MTDALAPAQGKATTSGKVKPKEVPALVQKLKVGKETVGDDLGLRMLNRVALQGSAVAVNVLAGPRTGLEVVSRLAARLKSPLHALNSIASVMLSGTMLSQAATVFILAAAGAVVAVRLLGVEVSAGLLVVAELLLAATVLVAMLRSGFVWQAVVLAVAVVVLGLAIAGEQVADVGYTRTVASAETELETGRKITLDPGSVIRVNNGERLNDIEASGIVIQQGSGTLVAKPAKSTDADWKEWGLTSDFSVLRVAVPVVLALFAIGRAFNVWKGRRQRSGIIAAFAAAIGATLVWFFGPQIGDALVTGTPGDSAAKDWLVDTAEFLNGIELTVVVLLLVLIPMAIGYGFDMTVRRWARAASGRAGV